MRRQSRTRIRKLTFFFMHPCTLNTRSLSIGTLYPVGHHSWSGDDFK